MSSKELPKWSQISREERFFTAILFHDIVHDIRAESRSFLKLLAPRLSLPRKVEITDVGYEAAFFRDAALANWIEDEPTLNAQKFDLMIGFSDKRMAIIEAKAQQGFRTEQIETLQKARTLIEESPMWPTTKVHIVGLWSAQYSPRKKTRDSFDAFLTWQDVADIYPENRELYLRADSIYSDKR